MGTCGAVSSSERSEEELAAPSAGIATVFVDGHRSEYKQGQRLERAAAHEDGSGSMGPSTVDTETLGRQLAEVSYLEGDFVLASGRRSRYYFDKYRFETRPISSLRLAS